MNVKENQTNKRINEPLVKSIRIERRVKENVKIYYLCNCLL